MTRKEILMPGGLPKYVRVCDDPTTMDRYTVVYTGHYRRGDNDGYVHLGMSDRPTHQQGYGQHVESEFSAIDVNRGGWAPAIGRTCHLGKRIEFTDLPEECQRLAANTYCHVWGL